VTSGLDIAQYAAETARGSGALDWSKLAPYLDHLSPSSLAMLRRCPRQFQERYIHGRKERPAEAPVIGTAVHAALERNFEQKIESHEDLPIAALLEWYSDEGFARTCVDEEGRGGGEILWDTDPDRARTRGRAMLGEYHNIVSPRVQPTSTEGSFSVDLGAPVPIVGRYDVERAESVIDVKTGKRKQSKPKEAWRIQAAVYGEARGRPVEFHSVTATEGNKVTIVTPLEAEAMLVQTSEFERAILRDNIRTIAAEAVLYMELLGPDQTWPTYGRFHDWACSFCGFRSDCPAWSSER
jgi:RecB family exonuclease